LYCSAHVLLGFHSQIEKDIRNFQKTLGPIGRDLDKKFSNFKNNSEPPSFRLIRMTCECLGPMGDEKNGARQQWLAYCSMINKKSVVQSYRGNRFNNIFEGARQIMYHKDDIIDFLTNHIESPNLKLQSILLDLKCDTVFMQVVCLAAVGCYITIPFWNLVNSKEHYVELYKFFQPLYTVCKLWSENCNEVFEGEIDPIFTNYPHKIDDIFNCLICNIKNCDESARIFFSLLTKCLTVVMERQLVDHLDGGKYSKNPDQQLLQNTCHAKITNIPAENLFGELDYAIKRKRNASLFHHSSIIMLKRNRTLQWLKHKSKDAKREIMKNARKRAKETKQKHKRNEKDVTLKRQEILIEIKLKKMRKQNKDETELKRIENSVKNMGGIVRSVSDIDNLLKLSKSLKHKKEKLRDQLLYLKFFMDKDIDRKMLYISSNTMLKFKQSLIDILELCKEKCINVGTWVAVAYQNNWYPGEVTQILNDELYTVNFMKSKKVNVNAFVWPTPVDVQDVEKKFIFSSHFEIMPTSGLRFCMIPDFDDLQSMYADYIKRYF